MVAAAAIAGSRRGREKAKKETEIRQREEMTKIRRETAERYQKESAAVAHLMDSYDLNNTGLLEQDEIIKMLTDYNFHFRNRSETPSQEELGTLLTLCETEVDGKISKDELISAVNTWQCYLEKSDETRVLLEKYDISRTGQINTGELGPLLMELNDGLAVPDDVLRWVWEQADVSGDGALNHMELMRAIAAWYVWLPEEQPGGKPGMIGGGLDRTSMPPQQTPASSACCVVQ